MLQVASLRQPKEAQSATGFEQFQRWLPYNSGIQMMESVKNELPERS